MLYTTNYNLNKPEGTDLYNHLTVDNPNMDTIDAAMEANKLASVGAATELVSGTVHAITRSDSNQNIFKFKATGDFKAGDTITVDGVSVNAYTTGGQQLADDAYILSAQVLCILDGTSLWILVNKDDERLDNAALSASGLSALTPDITIQSGGYAKIGKLVVINLQIKNSTVIVPYSGLITGFPPVNALANRGIVSFATNLPNITFSLTPDGKIMNNEALTPSGLSCTISATYICD